MDHNTKSNCKHGRLHDKCYECDLDEEITQLKNAFESINSQNQHMALEAVDLQIKVEKLEQENTLLNGYKDLANERCQFIVNSVALGYCTLPDPETPDSAHNTYRRCNLVDSYAIEDLRKQAEQIAKDDS